MSETTHDRWTDRLSDYVDDEMDAAEREALERHLASCDACAAVVSDLESIVGEAATLGEIPPSRDLWPGIEERLGARKVVPLASRRSGSGARRFSFTVTQLAAAAVAFLLIGGLAVWGLRNVERVDSNGPAILAEGPGNRAEGVVTVVDAPEASSDWAMNDAVSDLERVYRENRDRLDPATARTVERNLAVIDGAIEEIRSALAEDPADPFLHSHLARTQQRKLDLLRETVTMTRSL